MREIPRITTNDILLPFRPVADSVEGEILRYDDINEVADKHGVFDGARWASFLNADEGTYEEYFAASQLAKQNLLRTARNLNGAHHDKSKQIWSERFTQSTGEIFGYPEVGLARRLAGELYVSVIESAAEKEIDPKLIEEYVSLSRQYLVDETFADSHEADSYADVAQQVGEYINRRFGSVFDKLQFESGTSFISATEFAGKVQAILPFLAENYDEGWDGWKVVRSNGGGLSVSAEMEEVRVGMRRVPMTPKFAKGVFAHEVLVHALRAVNGKKISDNLRMGLENYSDTEEGLGVLFQYAITGQLSSRNAESYVNIAMALGLLDGKPKTRQEMLQYTLIRERIMNQSLPANEQLSHDEVVAVAHERINRIYRGSLGNENIGVFTKDILYRQGFVMICEYIREQLHAGKNIDEVMDYLLTCKFDPLNDMHVKKVDELGGS